MVWEEQIFQEFPRLSLLLIKPIQKVLMWQAEQQKSMKARSVMLIVRKLLFVTPVISKKGSTDACLQWKWPLTQSLCCWRWPYHTVRLDSFLKPFTTGLATAYNCVLWQLVKAHVSVIITSMSKQILAYHQY